MIGDHRRLLRAPLPDERTGRLALFFSAVSFFFKSFSREGGVRVSLLDSSPLALYSSPGGTGMAQVVSEGVSVWNGGWGRDEAPSPAQPAGCAFDSCVRLEIGSVVEVFYWPLILD